MNVLCSLFSFALRQSEDFSEEEAVPAQMEGRDKIENLARRTMRPYRLDPSEAQKFVAQKLGWCS